MDRGNRQGDWIELARLTKHLRHEASMTPTCIRISDGQSHDVIHLDDCERPAVLLALELISFLDYRFFPKWSKEAAYDRIMAIAEAGLSDDVDRVRHLANQYENQSREQMDKFPCVRCSGTGYDPLGLRPDDGGRGMICSRCNGSGELTNRSNEPSTEGDADECDS